MPQYLAILEVSQKQAYIFGSKRLAENVARSEIIRYVTEELYQACGGTERHLVYAGGGHIILQFDGVTAEDARTEGQALIRQVTRTAYGRFGLEVFAKLMPYDERKTPGDNLDELIRQLERKKSLRLSAFHEVDTGLEVEGVELEHDAVPERKTTAVFQYQHPTQFHDLTDKDSKLAIIHIDGNSMGKKAKAVTQSGAGDWETCRVNHQTFSKAVDDAFQAALNATIQRVERAQAAGELEEIGFLERDPFHPIRPIIAAGDDICFVTAGQLGVECAAYFLRFLAEHSPYTACAGVVMVSEKYPFYRAYQTSEQLCDNAKKYAAQLVAEHGEEREFSAMDWHMEFGQGKKSLSETREDYIMDDSFGGEEVEHPIHTMNLRPLCVTGLEEEILPYRSYPYFVNLIWKMKQYPIPRSKMKGLRDVIRQGIDETVYYVRSNRIAELSKWAFDSKHQYDAAAVVKNGGKRDKAFFTQAKKEGGAYYRHSLYFDAIELVDHITLLGEEEQG